MKEDTRIEGPWEFGTKPLRQNVAGECKEARRAKNREMIDTPIHTLVDEGRLSIFQAKQLSQSIAIYQASKN